MNQQTISLLYSYGQILRCLGIEQHGQFLITLCSIHIGISCTIYNNLNLVLFYKGTNGSKVCYIKTGGLCADIITSQLVKHGNRLLAGITYIRKEIPVCRTTGNDTHLVA